MRKIVVSEFISLDGMINDPAWTFQYWNDEIKNFKDVENRASDALLLGRVTYEAFAQAWPASQDEGAERMNSLPKYVASNTLQTTEWNASIMQGDLVEEINKLKAAGEGDLLVLGSGKFSTWLFENDLVDQINLLVYPVVRGEGTRFFQEGIKPGLKLASSETYETGVLGLIYQRS